MIASVIDTFFSAPQGPGMPFGDSTLIVLDTIRVIILSLGGSVLLATPYAMIRTRLTAGQSIRFGALALFLLAAMGTEFDHIGDYAHWRLVVNIFAVIGAAYGMWSHFTWEAPAQIKRRGQGVQGVET